MKLDATLNRWLSIGALTIVFALSAMTPEASAQPQLNFKRIVNNWPTIELYFSVACNGQPAYFTDKTKFRVVENGIEIGEFELWCPDPTARCAISVALVFDVSGSMSGSGIAGAKAAGTAFVDEMDGVIDEAAIIAFHSSAWVVQSMTTIKPLLYNAINGLSAGGATAVWDGIYTGLTELIANGVNPCRAVIAMTDGYNNSGSRTPADIISLANRNRIRVFTIGLGGAINSAELQAIANTTGGRYYETPSPSQLTQIYKEISTIIFQGFQECLITYTAKCMDGGLRTVDLSLLNFCGGSDTKTKTYKAPKDTSTYVPLRIELGKRETRGNTNVKVPLTLVDEIQNDLFHPATFTILYDEACTQFVNIATPPGSLLEGVPITITPMPGGVTFQTTDRKIINGSGMLAELTFKASDPDTKDTTCCELKLLSWTFEAGCFRPVLKDGEICIIPRQPEVTCSMSAPSNIVWVKDIKDYNPNPFTVSMQIANQGDREARDVRFKIEYDKKDLFLVAPISETQNGTPRDLKEGTFMEARWDVQAKRRVTGDSVNVCIVATFNNHDEVRCCKKIWVPPAGPVLSCALTAPTITADRPNLRYQPMPFDVTVVVTNEGGQKTDTVFARIELPTPGDLRLSGADSPNRHTKKILPVILGPGGQGGTSWELTHPITTVAKDYIIRVWVKSSNADSSVCEIKVTIPPLDAPILRAQCFTPDSLHFDENIDAYIPNPFRISLETANIGGLPASNVSGYMYLPANVILTPTSAPQRQMFTPSTMNEYKGGVIPTISWDVQYTKRFRYDTYLEFKFVVGGTGPTGQPLDSVEVWCTVRVPGLMPSFACDISMPDSLGINAAETGVEPNPFTVTYRVWNTSRQVAKIATVAIDFPIGEGLTLDGSTPQTRFVDRTLNAGDTATYTWQFTVQNRITRRNVRFQVTAWDDENNPVICADNMPIANLKTSLVCNVQTTEPVVRYIPVLQEYSPTNWVITADLMNTGGAPITDVTAEIEFTDPTTLDLVEFDPNFPDNTNPKQVPGGVLFPAQSKPVQWGFRLKNPNTTGVSQYIYFNIKYSSKETPYITSGCEVPVEIEPVVTPRIVCQLQAPDTIWFNVDQYTPTPFDVRVRVENVGNGDAQNVRAFMLQDTRFTNIPPSSRDLGKINAGSVVDYVDNSGFAMKVNARSSDGYDTVRVYVVADGIPAALCEYPIFVQREQRPNFAMSCQATPDQLTFDDRLNDYVPNPFDVLTSATNNGDTRATNCQLVFVGPPRFTPVDNMSIIAVNVAGRAPGVMEVGDTYSFNWKLTALRRDIGGWDTLHYQIQGRGGLGNRVIIGECRVPVYVPPARAAAYQMICTAPRNLTFDNSSGSYVPDPFVFTAQVTNAGAALGQSLEVTALLPPGLIFAGGETATKQIGDLATNQTVSVQWLVRPITITDGVAKDLRLCAEVKDVFGKTGQCCTDVLVPPATKATLGLVCNAIDDNGKELDALTVDRQRGTYEVNPFRVTVKITNNGDRPADNVSVTVLPQSNELRVLGDPERFVAVRLDPQVTTDTISWNIYATPRTQSGYIDIRFVVTADGLASVQCIKPLYVPEVGRPMLDCNIVTTMSNTNDKLLFDYTIGDYKDDVGTRSSTNRYNVFKLTSHITNVGAAQANRVNATILPPEGVVLDEGETPVKSVGDMIVNGNATVSWLIRPIRSAVDETRSFTVILTSDNMTQQKCNKTVVIEGAPKVSTLTLPEDPVGQYGSKIAVPISIDPTIGKSIYSYKLNVQFDSRAVKFVDAFSATTLTERGWSGPRYSLHAEKGSTEKNIVRVDGLTTGSPLNSKYDGKLVVLVFEAIYGTNDESLKVLATDLKFVSSFVTVSEATGQDMTLVSSLNSTNDNSTGSDVLVLFKDGRITVSGDCIIPLTADGGYSLSQNKPNPFNPTTVIEYELPEETDVTLKVYDALGRDVETLVQGTQKAGSYTVTFDASRLSSGTYLYRLETPKYSKLLRMVLAR